MTQRCRFTQQEISYLVRAKREARGILDKYGYQYDKTRPLSQRLIVKKNGLIAYAIQFRVRKIKNQWKYTAGTRDNVDMKKLLDKYGGEVLCVVIAKVSGTYQSAWLNEHNYKTQLEIKFALGASGLERNIALKATPQIRTPERKLKPRTLL